MSDSVTQSLSSLTLGGQAADPAAVDDADQFQPGDLIGPYRIVRLAGAGGMGVVYLAEQLSPVQRRLALKFVRRKGLGDLADAYFLVERQALAQLDHPGVAVLYDAGRLGGLLYFAMEWVDGAPIDRYVAEHGLDRRARLQLFIRACRAVHHAHTRGIIHRDLKPENILVDQVDDRPVPKVIDFGIALLGDSALPGTAKPIRDRAGTRAYMSPEQSESGAEIDIRTDVYALGVVLYVMLCDPDRKLAGDTAELSGRDVYDLLGQLHSQRAIANAQTGPEVAGAVVAELPSELRHVIGKALAPAKEDRYDSALALAEELERYLNGYAVRAMPAGRWYRLRKFVGRHAAPVAAIVAVVLALVVGLGAALYGLRSAEIESERALVAAELAQSEAQRAERIADFLQSILASVDPSVAGDLDKTLLRRVLDDAAARAATELDDDPALLASMQAVIGRSYRGLGDPQTAVSMLRQASAAQHPPVADTVDDLAMALDDLGQAKEALAVLDAALDELGSADDSRSADRLQLLSSRTEYLMRAENPAAALAAAEALLPQVEAEFGPDDQITLGLRSTIARALSDAGESERALALLEDIADRQLRTLGPSAAQTLHVQGALAIAYLQARRFEDALSLINESAPRALKVYGEQHQAILSLHSLKGSALKGLGRMDEAAEAFEKAYIGFLAKFGDNHPHVIGTSFNYAQALVAAGQFGLADPLLSRAAEQGPAVFGPEHPILLDIALAQGKSALRAGRRGEAGRIIGEVKQQASERLGPEHPIAAEAGELLAELEGSD